MLSFVKVRIKFFSNSDNSNSRTITSPFTFVSFSIRTTSTRLSHSHSENFRDKFLIIRMTLLLSNSFLLTRHAGLIGTFTISEHMAPRIVPSLVFHLMTALADTSSNSMISLPFFGNDRVTISLVSRLVIIIKRSSRCHLETLGISTRTRHYYSLRQASCNYETCMPL